MKKFGMLLFLFTVSSISYAENTPEDLIDPIISLIEKSEYSNIASTAFPEGTSTREYLSNAEIGSLDSQFEIRLKSAGKLYGYTLYHQADVPGIYLIRYFILRFERQPLVLVIEMYKPDTEWKMQGLHIDGDLDEYLENSANNRMGELGNSDFRENFRANK